MIIFQIVQKVKEFKRFKGILIKFELLNPLNFQIWKEIRSVECQTKYI